MKKRYEMPTAMRFEVCDVVVCSNDFDSFAVINEKDNTEKDKFGAEL